MPTSTPSPARHGVPAVLGGSAFAHDTATMPGGPQSSTNVHAFRIVDGLVAEVVSHPADGYGSDAALGTAVTLPDARMPAEPVRT